MCMSILQSVFNRVKPHLVLAVVCGFIFLASSGIVSAGVVNGTFFNSALKIFGRNASGNSVTVTNGSITSSSGQLVNQSGNLTTINGVSLGTNSAVNMTSTTVTGLGTFVGVKANSTLQGSSNGSTVSYALPAYGTSAVLGSTAHIVSGSRTTGTTGTVTISLTGAAVFSNANYFAYCLDDTTGAKSPGSAQTTSSFSCAMGAIGATDIMHYYAIGI